MDKSAYRSKGSLVLLAREREKEATNSQLGILPTTLYAHNVHSKMDKYPSSTCYAHNVHSKMDKYPSSTCYTVT